MAKGMLSVETTGSFRNIDGFFRRTKRRNLLTILEHYGERGVQLLSSATPVDSGETAGSWSYEIVRKGNSYAIYWKNSAMAGNTPIALLIQYGHGTRNGGYVPPHDFINPAIRKIFQEMANAIWREVTHA